MTEQDEVDRQAALDELEVGKSVDLSKAMESWSGALGVNC